MCARGLQQVLPAINLHTKHQIKGRSGHTAWDVLAGVLNVSGGHTTTLLYGRQCWLETYTHVNINSLEALQPQGPA